MAANIRRYSGGTRAMSTNHEQNVVPRALPGLVPYLTFTLAEPLPPIRTGTLQFLPGALSNIGSVQANVITLAWSTLLWHHTNPVVVGGDLGSWALTAKGYTIPHMPRYIQGMLPSRARRGRGEADSCRRTIPLTLSVSGANITVTSVGPYAFPQRLRGEPARL